VVSLTSHLMNHLLDSWKHLLESTMVTVATKWMGSSDLDDLNKRQVEQLAGASIQNKETTNKTSGKAKTNEARHARLLGT